MRSEQSWSLLDPRPVILYLNRVDVLDPRPVILYLNRVDEYIVYWNGIAMTHSMALCMAMEYIGIFPTPEMKNALESNYRKIYYSNGFQTRAWDNKVEHSNIYGYLKRIMAEHLKKTLDGKECKEILGWFDYKRTRKEETE